MNEQLTIWKHEKIAELVKSGCSERTAQKEVQRHFDSLKDLLPQKHHYIKSYLGKNTITVDEVRQLINYYQHGTHWRCIWTMIPTCGLRPGEVVGQKKNRIVREIPAVGLLFDYFHEDFKILEYPILKPKITKRVNGKIIDSIHEEKWRRVKIPEYVRNELLLYISEGEKKGMFYYDHIRDRWMSRLPFNRIFPIFGTESLDAEMAELRKLFGGAWLEKDKIYAPNKSQFKHSYRIRPHKLRHFYLTRSYYMHDMDLVGTMREIGHSKPSTTFGYTHSAEEAGSTREDLKNKTWEELLELPPIKETA